MSDDKQLKRERDESTLVFSSSALRLKVSNTNFQAVGQKRSQDSKEQFYTRVRIARDCLRTHLIPIVAKLKLQFDRIVEPSCGRGAFLKAVDSESAFAGCHVDAFDIDPQHQRVEKRDFLLDTPKYNSKNESILVVGNFPFGPKNVLVRKFVQASCSFASVIAAIFPKSFKKLHMQKTFAECWWLEDSFDLPKNSFKTNGKVHDVNCVFQVWIKKTTPRIVPKPPKPIQFCYVKDVVEADIAIHRNNGSAGKALCDLGDLKSGLKRKGNFFLIRLQADNDGHLQQGEQHQKQYFCDLFNQFCWPGASDTVGRKSLCKYEMTDRIDETIRQMIF